MNQEIIDKLHTALYPVAPLLADRERLIESMGETIWMESLEKVLMSVPEDKRPQVIALLNVSKLDEAVALLEGCDIDIDAIVTETAQSVLNDVIEAGKQA